VIRRVILSFFFLAPLIAIAVWSSSPVAAITIVFASHMLVLYPTLRASSQWLGIVVTRFQTNAAEVWITIDDGPSEQTAEMLGLLRAHDGAATFFVKGSNVRARPDAARMIVDAGCELANHSDTHPSGSFWIKPKWRIEREIDGCNEAIREITGTVTSRFRAPVGMKNPFVHPALAARGMTLIGWSARAFDGVGSAPVETMLDRLRRDLKPGAIILLHEGRPNNVAVLAALLDELDRRGLRAVVPESVRAS
jgi:peptidoglycan-N-acetylglucosamine deacetylase